MSQFSDHTKWQAELYDKHPPLNPFDSLLRQIGFTKITRPKDLRTKQYFKELKLTEETHILDIGCASGLLLQRIRVSFKSKGTGIDVSQVLIDKAKREDSQNTYLLADASNLPFPDNTFDIVTSFDNLEHIKEYKEVIKEIVRVLKPGGKLLLNTINKHNRLTIDWLLEKLGSDYHLRRAGHVKELLFDAQEIEKLFKQAGLTKTRIELTDATGILLADTTLYLFLITMEKIAHLTKLYEPIGKLSLTLTTVLSAIALPILQKTDTIITYFGHSNAFFLTGEKEVDNDKQQNYAARSQTII
jgi:ubiquinone/menaquinone biosynthesis C-methylase UbiE